MHFFTFLASSLSLLATATALNVPPYPVHDLHRRQLCNGTIALDNRTQTTTVAPGDTLDGIAARFNRGVCDIAAASNITNPDLIFQGQTIVIPPQVCFPDNTSCVAPPPTQDSPCVLGGPGFFPVKQGDDVAGIARSLNISDAALRGANGNGTPVQPGTFLNVPICAGSSCELGPYTIQSGDLFVDLAARFGSGSYGQILALNPNVDANALEVGTVITLPRGCRNGTEVGGR
ncbi:LysM domain-containing protein 2 [Elsinoe australis]|uniref:LysM domain-containing protein 2 n=1 Tax=Elsinoe australis TaxID=40998 RepID=A0A4U7AUU3_9PEZI|nr:LysM domain-containing protein 2 [Elsinoe australis]